jgi:hypothetical protein
MSLSGGFCGIIKRPVSLQVLAINASVSMTSPFRLDTASIANLKELFINNTLSPVRVQTLSVVISPRIFKYFNGFQVDIKMEIYVLITADSSFQAVSSLLNSTEQKLLSNTGRNIAEFIVVNTTITSHSVRTISPIQEIRTNCNNSGNSGSYFTNTTTDISVSVLSTDGAENTKSAIYLNYTGKHM